MNVLSRLHQFRIRQLLRLNQLEQRISKQKLIFPVVEVMLQFVQIGVQSIHSGIQSIN
jgi:hypothetical protein